MMLIKLFIFFLLLLILPDWYIYRAYIHRAACGCHYQHRHRQNGDQDGQQQLSHLCPQLHDARSGGHEQQRKNTGQVGAGLLDLLQLYDPGGQGYQQQHQTVHTGRHRQRQHRVQHLAQKTKRENAPELKNILRVRTPLSGLMVL